MKAQLNSRILKVVALVKEKALRMLVIKLKVKTKLVFFNVLLHVFIHVSFHSTNDSDSFFIRCL